MPIIKSAIKKMHQDIRRTRENKHITDSMKEAIRTYRKSPSAKNLQTAYSALDRAVKKRVIHKNRAARLKSRLATKIKSQKSQPKSGPPRAEKVKSDT